MIDTTPRQIRSFVRRAGRFSDKQKDALAHLWEKYGVNTSVGLLDFATLFGRNAPTILEIGFGMGHSLLTMARSNPENNYLGIEVHLPGIATLLANIEREKLPNLLVSKDDAVEVFRTAIADQSLDAIQIYFPDPWPKKRHHKRRLIQAEFIQLAISKLKTGGIIHCATDWQEYAEHMMDVLSSCTQLTNQAGELHYSPRPEWRPDTKFENRGKGLGHEIWDLIFVKG